MRRSYLYNKTQFIPGVVYVHTRCDITILFAMKKNTFNFIQAFLFPDPKIYLCIPKYI